MPFHILVVVLKVEFKHNSNYMELLAAAAQELPSILWKPKAHFPFIRALRLYILSQTNPVHTIFLHDPS
jgi:hypothetical protein